MSRKLCGLALTVSLLAVVGTAMAAKYTIAGYPIPLMIENENSGLFVDVIKELIKRTGTDAAIAVYPPRRTVQAFEDGTIDGFFPALDVMIMKEKSATEEPLYFKEDFAFTQAGKPAVKSIADLKGKTVGITAGYPYAKELTANPDIKFEESRDDISNMQKLSAGRIDAFVVEEKTGVKAMSQSGVSNVTYAKDSPLSRQKVYIAFQPTPDGKKLAAVFSTALKGMKEDGTLEKIMSAAQ